MTAKIIEIIEKLNSEPHPVGPRTLGARKPAAGVRLQMQHKCPPLNAEACSRCVSDLYSV